MLLKELIATASSLRASDLHLEAGTPLVVRVKGELVTVGEPIAGTHLIEIGKELLGADGWNHFIARGSADVSSRVAGVQCRINLFRTVRGMAMVQVAIVDIVRSIACAPVICILICASSSTRARVSLSFPARPEAVSRRHWPR